MRYWFPYPLLSLSLLVFWLLVNQSVSPGAILLGSMLGISFAWAMVNLDPDKPHVRRIGLIATLARTVVIDVVKSNLAVIATILKSSGTRSANSGFVGIDVDLEDETALAILSCILAATPGSAWVEFDRQTGRLLLHVLDLENSETWSQLVKQHYVAPLKEIFE